MGTRATLEWCLNELDDCAGDVRGVCGVEFAADFSDRAKTSFRMSIPGQMRLHVNPPQGMRIEDSELYFRRDREGDSAGDSGGPRIELVLDNIGLPNSGINLAFGTTGTISNSDGEILIALKPGQARNDEVHASATGGYGGRSFRMGTFFFTPANITNQILDFRAAGSDRRTGGWDGTRGTMSWPRQIMKEIAAIPGAVDVHVHQQVTYPTMQVNVDRSKARQMGLTQQDVAQSMLVSLSGTGQTAPNEWLNTANGVNYQVVVQTPNYRIEYFACAGADTGDLSEWECESTARKSCYVPAGRFADHHRPLQHSAGVRYLCGCR